MPKSKKSLDDLVDEWVIQINKFINDNEGTDSITAIFRASYGVIINTLLNAKVPIQSIDDLLKHNLEDHLKTFKEAYKNSNIK